MRESRTLMRDSDCVSFLRWSLPRMGFRWPGFRKVRHQVCKRIARRLRALALPHLDAYRAYLDNHPGEWAILDTLCRVSISRFYRDRRVWDSLGARVLPEMASRCLKAGESELSVWSSGACSGEEPYTLSILWRLRVAPNTRAPLGLRVLATEADEGLIVRAQRAGYGPSSLKDLPEELLREAFDENEGVFRLRGEFRKDVAFQLSDVRREAPKGPFHLVFCRNLAFTYLDEAGQREALGRMLAALRPGGVLVIGIHEHLPGETGLEPVDGIPGVFRRPG